MKGCIFVFVFLVKNFDGLSKNEFVRLEVVVIIGFVLIMFYILYIKVVSILWVIFLLFIIDNMEFKMFFVVLIMCF